MRHRNCSFLASRGQDDPNLAIIRGGAALSATQPPRYTIFCDPMSKTPTATTFTPAECIGGLPTAETFALPY
jgi:hypothetical protein